MSKGKDRATRDLAGLTVEDRIHRAADRADKLVDHVRTLFVVHESNAIVLYSSRLTDQIPQSYAAHAFNQFQRSMYLFELVRLAAVWDGYGTDRESIPTILRLIDEEEIIAAIVERTRAQYAEAHVALNITDADQKTPEQLDAIREWFVRDREETATRQAARTEQTLKEAICAARGIIGSAKLEALRGIRDYEVAHNMRGADTHPEKLSDVERWKYGGETELLEVTVGIVDALYGALHNTSFLFEDARQQSKRDAEELWSACRFEIPSRR